MIAMLKYAELAFCIDYVKTSNLQYFDIFIQNKNLNFYLIILLNLLH